MEKKTKTKNKKKQIKNRVLTGGRQRGNRIGVRVPYSRYKLNVRLPITRQTSFESTESAAVAAKFKGRRRRGGGDKK